MAVKRSRTEFRLTSGQQSGGLNNILSNSNVVARADIDVYNLEVDGTMTTSGMINSGAQYIDVKALGILGDGTDETAAIMAVVAAHPNLYWSAGTYATLTSGYGSIHGMPCIHDNVNWYIDPDAT